MQTSVRSEERLGRPGHPVGEPDGIGRTAEVAMRPGDLAIRGTSAAGAGKTAKKLTAPAAADPDGFKTNIGSTAGIQTFLGADFQGVIGTSRMFPARNVVLVLSNHADWDATNAVVTGLDEFGREITEILAIPNGGNATVTGVKLFSKIISLVIPAQSGAGGTATFGTGTLLGGITSADALGIVRYKSAVVTAQSATFEFAIGDDVSIIDDGSKGVWVEVEETVEDGEQVFARLVIAGDEVIGGLRNDRDGTAAAPDAVPVYGMRFQGDSEERDGVKLARVAYVFPNS